MRFSISYDEMLGEWTIVYQEGNKVHVAAVSSISIEDAVSKMKPAIPQVLEMIDNLNAAISMECWANREKIEQLLGHTL